MPQAYSVAFAIVVMGLIGYVRTRTAMRGSKVSRAKTYGLGIFYVAFASYLVLNSFAGGVPIIYATPYVLTFFAAEYFSNRYSDKALRFWKTSDGVIYSKGGTAIYMTYVGATAVRIIVSMLGSSTAMFVYSPAGAQAAGPATTLAFIVSDFMLVLGAGLLVGLNRRINLHYNLIKKGEEAVPVL
ncbi:MAG: hypothetical protein ABI348_04395 [Nitrososphaera sp.]